MAKKTQPPMQIVTVQTLDTFYQNTELLLLLTRLDKIDEYIVYFGS